VVVFGQFLEVLIGGLLAGVLYSLVALGFVLIFKASGVFNFAQGAMVLFAALSLVRLMEWMPIPLALLASVAIMIVFALVVERLVLRPLVNQEGIILFMATIGISYFIDGFGQTVWGSEVYKLDIGLPNEPMIILVDWPDAPQATLRIAGPGISRSDDRWAPLFVANFSVGGTFSSRINSVLREQKGVTYGASSSLDTARGAGLVTVSSAVRTDATAESVRDVVEILREVVTDGLTDDEVSTGVRAASESAPLGFERAESVVSRVELLLAQGLPLDHVDANLARIRAVTRAEAEAAYRGVVDPERLTVVVVGDADAVEADLAALGYAPVERRQPPTASSPS